MVQRTAFAGSVSDCMMFSFFNPKVIRVVAFVCMTQMNYFEDCVWIGLQKSIAMVQSCCVSGNVNVVMEGLSFAASCGSVRCAYLDLVVPTFSSICLRNDPATELELVCISGSSSLSGRLEL